VTAVKRWAGFLPLNANPSTGVYTTKYRRIAVELTVELREQYAGTRAIDSTYTPSGGDYSIGSFEYPLGSSSYVTAYNHDDGSPANWTWTTTTFTATLEQALTTLTEDGEWHPPGTPVQVGNRYGTIRLWFPVHELVGFRCKPGYPPAYHKLTCDSVCLTDSVLVEQTQNKVTDCNCAVDEDLVDLVEPALASLTPTTPMEGCPCPALPSGYDANDANGENVALTALLRSLEALSTGGLILYDDDTVISEDGLTGTFVVGDNSDKAAATIVVTYAVTLSDPYTLAHALADGEAMLMGFGLSDGAAFTDCSETAHTLDCVESTNEEDIADVVIVDAPDCTQDTPFSMSVVEDFLESGLRAQRRWFDEAGGYGPEESIGYVVLTKTLLGRTSTWTRCCQEQTHSNQYTDSLGSGVDCETRPTGTDYVSPDVLDGAGLDWGIVTES
jgi:hypothetical protein